MSSTKNKNFDWKTGETIKSEDYAPLGQIKETGFSKLADALYADPELRKKKRAATLNRPLNPLKNEEFLIENSTSGVSEEYTPTNDSRLLEKSKQITGLSRFKDRTPKK